MRGLQIGSTRFAVMRKPVLMEDEGRPALARTFTSKTKAEEWIRAQKGQFFGPSDYYILEEVR